MDWTAEKARQAEATLRKFYTIASEARDNVQPYLGVQNALADDINTAQAVHELHQLAHAGDSASLRASLRLLGFLDHGVPKWATAPEVDLSIHSERLTSLRAAAMTTKDFSAVDTLKSSLIAAGVEVRMSKAGVELVPGPDFNPAKLEALL
jgi:cysteinyl-tRNA synthetase